MLGQAVKERLETGGCGACLIVALVRAFGVSENAPSGIFLVNDSPNDRVKICGYVHEYGHAMQHFHYVRNLPPFFRFNIVVIKGGISSAVYDMRERMERNVSMVVFAKDPTRFCNE